MKYAHTPNIYLTTAIKPGDRLIQTSQGNYKLRKNGRMRIFLDRGKENEEMIRVTPLEEESV